MERNQNKEECPLVYCGNKHKKQIAVAGRIIGAVCIAVLGAFGVKYYLISSSFERWLKKAPLDELKTVRGNAHSEYMMHTFNDEYRERLWNFIRLLDRKISKIECASKTTSGPAYHREHGFNLYKPD